MTGRGRGFMVRWGGGPGTVGTLWGIFLRENVMKPFITACLVCEEGESWLENHVGLMGACFEEGGGGVF